MQIGEVFTHRLRLRSTGNKLPTAGRGYRDSGAASLFSIFRYNTCCDVFRSVTSVQIMIPNPIKRIYGPQ